MACKYFLTINGSKHSFNSERDLDAFIAKNYGNMLYYNKYGDAVFDESNTIQDSIYNKLLALNSTVQESRFNQSTQENEVVTPKRLGVTTAITTWLNSNGDRVIPEFKVEEYKKNQLKLLIKEGLSEEDAKRQIEFDIENWGHLAKIGDKVHKVAELYFKNQDLNTISQIVDLPYDTIENLYFTFKNLESKISKGKKYKFIPELTLQTSDDESDPIIGRLDLLAIDERGNVEIYDFKISNKPYETWYSSKQLTIDYQLAAYRALLANNGIGVKLASLNIVPIIISDIDYTNETFTSYKVEEPINKTTEGKSMQRLSYPNGYITRIVQEHIRANVSEVSYNTEATKNVAKYSEIAFGKLSKETPKEFVERVAKYDNYRKVWFFNDYVSKRKGQDIPVIEAPTKEELLEKAREYQEKMEDRSESYYFTLWKEFDYLKKTSESLEDKNKFKYLPQKANTYLTRVFCNYIDNPGYEVLDLPELAEIGIYAFRDVANNIVDIISMTDINLTKKLNWNNGSHNIFGNLGSEAKYKKLKNLLSNTVGNAKLLETMLVINELHDYFSNFKIGNIQVINYKEGQSYPIDINKLTHNFNILSKELGITNYFKSELIIADRIEALKLRLLTILGQDRTELVKGASDLIYDFYNNYKLDNETGKYKIEQLRKLQEIIREVAGNRLIIRADNNYDSDPTGLSLLYSQISRTILHYKRIYFDSDHDISQISFNLKNISETMTLGGYYVENPEMIPLMKDIVDLTELQFQKMREWFEKYKEKSLQRVLELYKSKGFTQVERWTFKDSTNAFKNMFERDSTGRIARNFRVKNPYDMTNDLSQAERKWLKSFLWNINRIKRGVDYNLTEEEAIKTTPVQELIQSGHYFDIPLLRGTAFSQLKSKGFFSWIQDKWNEQVDIRRATKAQEETIEQDSEAGKNDYLTMYNFLNVSPTTREKYLSEQDTSYWETNLELLEDVFIHAYIRKSSFDTILPLINDIRHAIYLQSYDTNINFENLNKQIDIYLKTVIFGESSIEKSNQKFYKVFQPITTAARVSMLALNLNSLVREPIQGFYLLMTRAAGRLLGDNGFTTADAAKAYGIVMGNTGVSSDNWTLVEALNHFYGMTRMDANSLAYELNSDRKGYKGLLRRGAYWATTAPDFLNRMVFIVAQMIHDDCLKAHHMSKDGELIYDWTKDGRYSIFASGDKSHPLYNKQKADYIAHLTQFNIEHENDLDWEELKFNESNPVALPSAYTIAEKRNIKSSADSLFGYMDHENAFAARHKFVGKILFQFKSYFSSTRERFFLGGTDKTPKGEWKQKTDEEGNLLYLKSVIGEDGESHLIETTEVTDIPAKEWSGRFIEGMVNSTFYYMQYLFKYYINKDTDTTLEHKDYRIRNARQLLIDSMWAALLALLFRLIMEDKEESGEEFDPLTKNILRQTLLNSTDELVFWAPLGLSLDTPVALSFLERLKDSTIRIAKGESSFGKEAPKNFYVIKQTQNVFNLLNSEE